MARITQTLFASSIATTSRVLNGLQVFTADGIYTPTSGTTKALVQVMGGGGGGGGCGEIASVNTAFGGGGAGGGTRIALYDIDDTLTGGVVIGAGGIGDSESVPFPAAAEDSTFTFDGVTATGEHGSRGDFGVDNSALRHHLRAAPLLSSGGPPGSHSISGQPGGRGNRSDVLDTAVGGDGGDSYFGAGADGARVISTTIAGFNGVNALANSGGGGGGAANTTDNAAFTGGTGGSGQIVIYEYK